MTQKLALYPAHDASIAFVDGDNVRIFEFERLIKERYANVKHRENWKEIYENSANLIKQVSGVDKFSTCYHLRLPEEQQDFIRGLFSIKRFEEVFHHESHAAGAFVQSSFEEALVISFDGGGLDYLEGEDRIGFFNIFIAQRGKPLIKINSFRIDLGSSYAMAAVPIKEIKKDDVDWGKGFLSFPGKKMGLAGYGKVRQDWIKAFKRYYLIPKHLKIEHDLKVLCREVGIGIGPNVINGELAYDFAATSQFVFEEIALDKILPDIRRYKLPVVLTGGCALNVLFNERLRQMLGIPIFVPPNPNDCGLAFGMLAIKHNFLEPPVLTYSGAPILDINSLANKVSERNAIKFTINQIANLLQQGRIIGVMRGNSEHGPRALGNRSIICNPAIPNMKDILNAKVKYREWFRPFAPVVKQEDVGTYFDFDGESPYMSFAPNVANNMQGKFPAIEHVDGTARVQTITEKQNPFLYNLIEKVGKICGKSVILNTSLNIKGKPILTEIRDALEVLDSTDMDYLIIEDYLFSKKEK